MQRSVLHRFCLETQDMNCNKVIEALLNGLERGKKDFGIEYGVITCAMRHHSEEENAG